MKKVKGIKEYIASLSYIKFYEKLQIDPYSILMEASHGKSMQGNIFYLLRELIDNDEYKGYKIFVTIRDTDQVDGIKKKLKSDMRNIRFIIIGSKEYYKVIATAKYLINDTSFRTFYIKKEGQIYLNVWHGTPLKTLGRRVKNEPHKIGNIQKNLVIADYLLYPNEYTMEHMLEDYMLPNISNAKILMGGYPRNIAFFDEIKKAEIIEQYKLRNKKIYVYMPTWRGLVDNIDYDSNREIKRYLSEIDERLTDDEIFYLKLHTFVQKSINVNEFKHIRVLPDEFEVYEMLNVSDCLITDYSSVLYDYAVTGKKIVLFTYDEEEYLSNRGLYEPLENLPFDRVKDVDTLIEALRSEKHYDDSEFIEKYCKYDSADAAKALCETVIQGKNNAKIKIINMPSNGKKNILISGGRLAKNGITTSLMNLLNEIDTDEYNYYITTRDTQVEPNKNVLHNLPEGVDYVITQGRMNTTFKEKIILILYRFKRISFKMYLKTIRSAYYTEIKRTYGNALFDTVINFTGYGYKQMLLYSLFDSNRVIYVHNDMVEEINTKGNQRGDALKYSYSVYDKVAVVTQDILESTKQLVDDESKLKVARNIIDYKSVVNKSELPFAFDDDTQCNVSFDRVKEILESDSKVFLNIGRYSPEKGQKRLIDAFDKLYSDNKDIYLIIVGGYQSDDCYDELIKHSNTLNCKENVILVLSMSNPFPLIKKCDFFVLSSLYEGFGLVLAEANILGLPVISTDIPGPRTFMQKNGGRLVDDSEEGILAGMRELLNGNVPVMDVDYEAYNKEAVMEYKELLKK